MRYIDLLTGKGGVGKSTCSSLLSVFYAKNNLKTLLVSMDPAHNLGDIFESKFSEKARGIMNGLDVIEIDKDKRIKSFLHESEKNIKENYAYLSSFNLDSHFKVLKHSPGMEEGAMFKAFFDILQRHSSSYDYMVFDMPPTALSTRFLSLPFLSNVWIDELIELRKNILKKHEIIDKIKLGKKTLRRDRVMEKLEALKKEYQKGIDLFHSNEFRIHIVANPEKISLNEAKRLENTLRDLGIKVFDFFVNKSNEQNKIFRRQKTIALFSSPLIGLSALSEFVEKTTVFDSLF